MNTRITSRARVSAFTLIELLTVIAIIAILMALLFPVIGTVKETARKTQAKTDEMNVVAAVKAFNTEYGKYPNVDPNAANGATGDTLVGDMNTTTGMANKPTQDNNTLFDILRNLQNGTSNSNYTGNPRRIVFFEGKSVTNPTAPKSGFLDNTSNGGNSSSKGGFFDPWGTEYFIYMDTDYDNQIDVSANYTDFKNAFPQVGVAAFSFGKDRALGSPNASPAISSAYKQGNNTSDDVLSWQ